jgi:hypothetical protein
MKNFFMAVAVALAVVCACSGNDTKDKSSDKSAANVNQHIAVGVMAAIFLCDYHRWPRSLGQLQEYDAKKKIDLPVAIDWVWLARPGVEFVVGEQIKLQTPAGDKKSGDIAVGSVHSRPACEGNKIDPKIHLNLG